MHDAGKKSCFGLRDGRKFQVRYNEADVSFPIVSIGEASQQGNWFVFGPGCQAMLPGASGEFLRTCVKDPNAAKLENYRGVYWVAMFGDGTHGRSSVVPKSQSGKASCWGGTNLCAGSRCFTDAVGRERGNTQTKTHSTASKRE